MKRRLFSLFLALTLVVGMLPAPAFAQETEPTQVTEAPTEAPATEAPATEVPATEAPAAEVPATEAPAAEVPAAEPAQPTTEAPTEAPEAAEVPAEETAVPGEDEAVTAVQAMIDALPDVDHMSEEYIDALEAAYSAYETLSEAQQAKITGVEKLEALFNWVNSQVSTLAEDVKEISGEMTWNNQTFTTPVKLTGETTLTLTGTNRIECDQPLDLNGKNLTIQGTGTLELVGKGGSYFRVDATLCDSTYTSNNIGGALTLAGGTVKVSGSDQNAVCVYNLKLNGGKLEAYGGKNAGIACTLLQTTSGSLYATGDDYGICMYRPNYGAAVNKLTILVSKGRDAEPADNMEVSDENAIAKAGIGDFRTVYIGEVTGPLLSVKAQKGYLYEATAKTATFALSGRNVDLSALTFEWTGSHTGLEAAASADGKTLTVTTNETVQAGTYGLKVSAGEASRTVVVTVSGPPIRILTQPVDTISTDPEAGAVYVSACPTKGHTGSIAFQWKRADGTPIPGYTEDTVLLYGMDDEGMLTQDESKPWLKSIRIYCTLSYDGYSLDTDTVTLGLSSCPHPAVDHEGNCLQCGQKKGSNKDALLVKEDGLYHLIANAEPGEADVGLFMYSGGNFWLTGDVPHKIVNVSCTDVGGKDVTLDLQGHTVNSLQMGNFPYGTFTVKNGTLGVIDTDAGGKLILENIHYKDPFISALFDLTVQGKNTRFEWPVVFHGTTHLMGGHFEQGLDSNCADRALELLEEGFAFYNSANEVVDATDYTELVGREIHVASHTCHYSNGKCDCGRSCTHSTVSDETGLCQECGGQVYEANVTAADGSVTGYRTLEEALRSGADATVKLLADCVVEETEEAFYVTVPLTLDLNGKRMEGPSGLIVQKGPTTIRDSSPAQTGTIAGTSDWKYSGVGLWVFKNANVTLTILGGHFEGKTDGLLLAGQNTLILKGGSFSSIHFIEGATATLWDALAPGYAYYDADNTLYDPGDGQGVTVGLHVGAHTEHTPDSNGHCPCGYTVAATLDTDAGKQYFADFGDALEAAKAASGSTLTLFRDVTLTGENNLYINNGTFTIDWNGHTLSGSPENYLMVISDLANVTLKDSSGNNTGGACQTGYGMAVHIAVGSEGSVKIQGGTYSPNVTRSQRCYGSVQISGGVFANPQGHGMTCALFDLSGNHLSGMLAPDTAFAYEADGSDLLNAYNVNMSENYKTVYAVPHTHENFDENGVCTCGYPCPHDQVDEEGVCTDCGKQFYVQGTYEDGTTHYYGTLSDALRDPAVTQAVILCSGPVCESWNGGGRRVTLDLNGIPVVLESIQGGHLILCDSSGADTLLGMKEIQKDGQVSVESGSVVPQAETLSVYGKLTVTGGYVDSLTAMEGSTVSLSGGSFGKIVGSGVTLRSLLAENYYYAELNGGAPKNYADTDTVIEQVSVVVCDHTSVRENKGTYFSTYTCNCGQVTYRLTVTVGENNPEYFREYNDAFAYAAKKDGVVRFLTNGVNGTIEVNAQGTVTIDMENRSYRAGDRSLVIKSGSTVRLVGQGSVMSTPEPGSGGSGSGKLEYSEFIPVTVEAGGTFVLPAKKLGGGENMAKPYSLTVQSGGTAELQGGSTGWTSVYGTLIISGGNHGNIDQYDQGQLNITGGDIKQLQIYGDLPRNALSGGSYGTISAWESNPRESVTEKLRNVTFDDFQNMLASGKVFQNTTNQSYPNQVETDGNYGFYYYKKDLSNVRVTAAPFTGVEVVCQLGTDTYEEKVSTQYNVGETDSSGNVVFLLGVRTQPQEVQSGVTVQWYELGAEDSRTPVGTDLTCPLDTKLPVGTHRFLAVVNCSGYVLESQPFAVTITPRVVNITGGFTAQDRDYELDNRSVRIIQGEVTFDKKAEEDDLSAQVHGGTIATPEAGQNRTVDYSVTLTGRDKDNYTLGSKPELTVTIRPIAQTLTFAETAVTKTYGDSPFVNALDHSAGDGQITYTSSDPAVATVGIDGTVTIRGAGEARITATAAATQNYVETAASFDLTVAKATGTVRNRNYSLGYLYGDDIPTPERKYFEASSTGAFRYSWSPAAPKNAGKYQLTVTVDEDGNYTSATLVLNVLVEKDVWVRPTLVKAENETVDGKKDGKVTYTDTPALEYRPKRTRGEWIPVAVPAGEESVTVEGLAPGTYEFRRPGDENHFASSPETITIQPGPKLTVTLPSPQTGYTLTADKVELSWHDSLKLTLTVAEGYYKTASFAVKAGNRTLTEENGTFALTDAEENVVITLEGVEKDEKAPGLSLQNWIFGQGVFQGMASRKDWKNISTATAPYYVISTRGNYFTVEASDGETGLASASYLRSRTALTREDLEQAAWEPVPEESLNQAGPDREHMIQLDLGEWYFYVKAVDKAGNVSYVGSDKLIREENAPRFGGVTNGATYYTTQKVTITDDYALSRYLPPMDRYWKDISGTSYEVTLEGNREGTYTLKVEDACQNTATLTVYMKPISALTEDIRDLTEDNVCKSDLDQLTQAEKALKALDTTYATDEEKKTITEALDHIGKLKTVLEEVTQVEAMIAALPDSVEPYQQTVEDTQIKPARDAYNSLTDHQKTLVDSTKLDKLVRLEAQLNAWTITEGDGQTWYKGSWNPLSFTVNGQTRKFSKVLLDGKMHITATPSFLAVSGSIDEPFTLTLKPEFLQFSMKPGEHTLTVIYGENNSGTGTVTFTVEIPANYLDVTGKPEFDGKTTVTVDGKEYPIEEMNGTRYVNLPETGDLLTIYSFKDGTPAGSYTNYPTGMQVFRITRQEGGAKAEEITEFANLLNYAGCSIRLTGTKGIRMITGISETKRTALIGAQGLAGYTLEEYGTVVMRGVGTPTLENSNSHNFAYKKGKADPVFARAGGMIQYTNVLVGFSLEDCKDTLTLRPYIKLKDMTTGETVTLYGGCVSRSIGYIARQNANTYQPGTAGYKYVHEIIDAVYGKTEQGGETK